MNRMCVSGSVLTKYWGDLQFYHYATTNADIPTAFIIHLSPPDLFPYYDPMTPLTLYVSTSRPFSGFRLLNSSVPHHSAPK